MINNKRWFEKRSSSGRGRGGGGGGKYRGIGQIGIIKRIANWQASKVSVEEGSLRKLPNSRQSVPKVIQRDCNQ